MLGEQVFDALGGRWTLFLGTAAQCMIEERFDRGFYAVVEDAMPSLDPATLLALLDARENGVPLSAEMAERAMAAGRAIRISTLREIAWAGMQRHHPGITLEQVSDLIDALGSQRFGEIVGNAIRAARGEAEVGDDADRGNGATPLAPARKRGPTGKRSSRSGAGRGSRKVTSG